MWGFKLKRKKKKKKISAQEENQATMFVGHAEGSWIEAALISGGGEIGRRQPLKCLPI